MSTVHLPCKAIVCKYFFPRRPPVNKKYFILPFFAGRKRFAVPRDKDPTPLPAVRLFQRRNNTCGQVEVAPPTENQQPTTGPSEIDAAACDFCLQMPCITLSASSPWDEATQGSPTTQNAEKTTSGSGGH